MWAYTDMFCMCVSVCGAYPVNTVVGHTPGIWGVAGAPWWSTMGQRWSCLGCGSSFLWGPSSWTSWTWICQEQRGSHTNRHMYQNQLPDIFFSKQPRALFCFYERMTKPFFNYEGVWTWRLKPACWYYWWKLTSGKVMDGNVKRSKPSTTWGCEWKKTRVICRGNVSSSRDGFWIQCKHIDKWLTSTSGTHMAVVSSRDDLYNVIFESAVFSTWW